MRADFLAIGERNVEATMIIARMHPAIGWKLDGNSMARVAGLEFYGNLGLRALAGEKRLETYIFAMTATSLPAMIAGEKDENYST